jgi:hypothetical protein
LSGCGIVAAVWQLMSGTDRPAAKKGVDRL